MLPKEFVEYTSELFGEEGWKNYLSSFEGSVPVSVRLNPFKVAQEELFPEIEKIPVPWCRNAFYLAERPNFTLDPLLHAGVYYVQEAGSMFLDEVLRQLAEGPLCSVLSKNSPFGGGGACLDLCAAPGGKSTLLRAFLPDECVLYSNEPDRRRANILMENIQKQGHPNVIVTNNYAIDYQRAGLDFDLIVCDVPCSGEGMFRKDEGAVTDWSMSKVKNCAELQHQIIDDIWNCLKPGGLLIYSTCTFNADEDEKMVEYICDELGGTALEVPTEESWNIHKPLTGNNPCYRFMPHFTKGEGLFMAAIRKDEGTVQPAKLRKPLKNSFKVAKDISNWVNIDVILEQNADGVISAIPQSHKPLHDLIVENGLYVLQSGIELGTIKGKDIIPSHSLALSSVLSNDVFPRVSVDLQTAQNYLRRLVVDLQSEVPNGYVIIEYLQKPLGFVKNLGNRCNNLYPQEWRIRNL